MSAPDEIFVTFWKGNEPFHVWTDKKKALAFAAKFPKNQRVTTGKYKLVAVKEPSLL